MKNSNYTYRKIKNFLNKLFFVVFILFFQFSLPYDVFISQNKKNNVLFLKKNCNFNICYCYYIIFNR